MVEVPACRNKKDIAYLPVRISLHSGEMTAVRAL
jgi:hypothetical protein